MSLTGKTPVNMVNHGRSKGCVTCKERRVKCDEAKPKCWPCQRLKLKCSYQPKTSSLRFKSQNHKFYTERTRALAPPQETHVSSHWSLSAPDTSVSFFLQYYALMGREMGSARGFYEVLVPVYLAQPQSSPLVLGVSALASEVLSLWRREPIKSTRQKYSQAIKCLRSAIKDQSSLGKPETVMAVLSLHWYETVAAIYDSRSGTAVHHDGALSLLPFMDTESPNQTMGPFLRNFIVHNEICSALRQERPLRITEDCWHAGKGLMSPVDNPSSRLDSMGAAVAELQASYIQFITRDNFSTSSPHASRDWKIEAEIMDEQLLTWANSLPSHWSPIKLRSGHEIDTAIPTYQSVCEIYPTCQIANIWNLWRIQRLLLLRIIIGSLVISGEVQLEVWNNAIEIRDYPAEYTLPLQELVDSVCYSVPFYLGNRAEPMSLTDFSETGILLPSYHSLAAGDMPVQEEGQMPRSSADEYRRHILAQGPWHIMSPLSRLLTLFSEGDTQLMAGFLRPGQLEWIQEQFSRVTILLHIPAGDHDGSKASSPISDSFSQASLDLEIVHLAKEIRKGATFMSGP